MTIVHGHVMWRDSGEGLADLEVCVFDVDVVAFRNALLSNDANISSPRWVDFRRAWLGITSTDKAGYFSLEYAHPSRTPNLGLIIRGTACLEGSDFTFPLEIRCGVRVSAGMKEYFAVGVCLTGPGGVDDGSRCSQEKHQATRESSISRASRPAKNTSVRLPAPISGTPPIEPFAAGAASKRVELTTPPHLYEREPILGSYATSSDRAVATSRGLGKNAFHERAGARPFEDYANELLEAKAPDPASTQLGGGSAETWYDFDEYVSLADDGLMLAPRLQRFANIVEQMALWESQYLWTVLMEPHSFSQCLGTREQYVYEFLRYYIMDQWIRVCASTAFTMLCRYTGEDVEAQGKVHPIWSFVTRGNSKNKSERWYGYWLGREFLAHLREKGNGFVSACGYGDQTPQLVDDQEFYRLGVTNVFQLGYSDTLTDRWPTADKQKENALYENAFPVEPIDTTAPFFGLRVVHRQSWRHLRYARGELVKTVPLAPKESQKVSMKILRRRKRTWTAERAQSYESSLESADTTKTSAEVIDESTSKLNRHAEAEVGGGFGGFVQAKVSGGISEDVGQSSKNTSTRLNETMQKTASRMKTETRTTVSVEGEDTFSEERSSELMNPNDEIGVTYLYHRLQQQFWVHSKVAEVHSVVYVPQPMPSYHEISDDWIKRHGDVLLRSLIDVELAEVLNAIRNTPANVQMLPESKLEEAVTAGIEAAKNYKQYSGGSAMPDLLASGQSYYVQEYDRRNAAELDRQKREHQRDHLIQHIRENIYYYMRRIWAAEDHDQRMQRLAAMWSPTGWRFKAYDPANNITRRDNPFEVAGHFVPVLGSARPMSEIVDLSGPIGYVFNCAVYKMRDDFRLVNLHEALSCLRSVYTRMAVTIEISDGPGFIVRQAVALYAWGTGEITFTCESWAAQSSYWKVVSGEPNDTRWIFALDDGSLECFGVRIWTAGLPRIGLTIKAKIHPTSELEDPHLRLVKIMHPPPAPEDESSVYVERFLREMLEVLPELALEEGRDLEWAELSEAERERFRAAYHRFIMLRNSGRLVTLDTANLLLELEISQRPALEPFKRLHRYVDVMKEHEEMRRRALENERRKKLLEQDVLGDPDIERVTVVAGEQAARDLVVVPADSSD